MTRVTSQNARRRVSWLWLVIAGGPLLAVALYVGVFLYRFGLPPDPARCQDSLIQPTACSCYWAAIRGLKCL